MEVPQADEVRWRVHGQRTDFKLESTYMNTSAQPVLKHSETLSRVNFANQPGARFKIN